MGLCGGMHSLFKGKDGGRPSSIHLPLWARSCSLCWRLKRQAQILFSWPWALSPSSSNSASLSIQQITAGTRCHLSWFVAVCPAESVRRFVMQNIVKRLLSMQQPHKHFLNETSQTQRQTPVQSTGRHKLFHCVLDCQEEFCKYFNEGWTAPRQGCWKLIPDHLQYRSSNSSVFPSKLLGFAASLFRN